MPGVLSRSQWTTARPLQTRLTTMTPINYITVHHDGMSPFYDADQSSSAARLESIRRSHRDGNRWADIGYHFAIDRSGRVWECRSLAYQGAHVGNHNEGNIGVLVMGNFDQQTPSSRQLDALNAHLSHLMRIHRVPLTRVATHREWETARTACPGSTLQSHMDLARRRGWLG
jgi:N-acetyl-anhydromuramyl-L-alanine amidase AmpD